MREAIWRHAMDEAHRVSGGVAGNYELPPFGSLTVTVGPSGVNYSIMDNRTVRFSGWRINGELEQFMPNVHTRGRDAMFEGYAMRLGLVK